MNHIVLIGHGKMGSALAKGWIKENSKYKISIIEKEELLLNYEKFTNVKVYKNFNEFFTENNGKIVGIIFGSTSKKIKSYLLIGNKFHLNYSSKNENSTGSFKVEIDKVNTALHLDNKLKLSCIIYSIQIIKILKNE